MTDTQNTASTSELRACCQAWVTSTQVRSPTECGTCGTRLMVRDRQWWADTQNPASTTELWERVDRIPVLVHVDGGRSAAEVGLAALDSLRTRMAELEQERDVARRARDHALNLVAEKRAKLAKQEAVIRDTCNEYPSYEEFDPLRELVGLPPWRDMRGEQTDA